MRRIIERIVTVVTTTTWKISWEADRIHTEPAIDSVSNEASFPGLLSEIAPGTQQTLAAIELKEDDPLDIEQTSEKLANEPPQKPYSYKPSNERK